MSLTLALGSSSLTCAIDPRLCAGWTFLARRLNTFAWGRTKTGATRCSVPTIFNPPSFPHLEIRNAAYLTSFRLYQTSPTLRDEKSFYDHLEIHPQASSKEVKAAFYRLSKLHHPDSNINDTTALARFQAISEAYEVLGNPQLRAKYDKGVLGRSSSVAEREQASHRFDKESFYEKRSDREAKMTGSKKLDNWITSSKTHSFRRKQEQKAMIQQGKDRGSIRKAEVRTARSNEKVDSTISFFFLMGFFFCTLIYIIIR